MVKGRTAFKPGNETVQSSLKERLAKLASAYELDGTASRVVPMEGLRGFAVLLVFFVHYQALFGTEIAPQAMLHRVSEFLGMIGNTGVDLFFVMSGYLIYGALIRRQVSYLKFTRRRIIRIYPTFLAMFALYLVLSVLFPRENKIHGDFLSAAIYIVQNLFLLPGICDITAIITVAWSLSFEFFFYLTVPLLIMLMRMRSWSSEARLLAFVAIWIGVALGVVLHPTHYYFVMPDHARMISFVAGIVLYELLSSHSSGLRLSCTTELSTIVLVAGALVLFYVVHQPGATLLFPRIPIYCIISMAFFFFALHAFAFSGVVSAVFSWAPLRCLGNMSYSYYLIHGLTLQALAKVLHLAGVSATSVPIALACLMIGFLGTLISSSILFFVVEKRFSLVHDKKTKPTVAEPSVVTAASGLGS